MPFSHLLILSNQKADIFGLKRARKLDVPLPVPYKTFKDVEEY